MRLAALAMACSACSYIANNGPKTYNPPGTPAPACSTSTSAATADVVLAGLTVIPTIVAIGLAWQDPRWSYADGEAGGVQTGAIIGIPYGALFTLAVFSARSGLRAANGCEAARERAGKVADEHGAACRATFQALADARLAYADPLPAWCDLDEAGSAFLLADAPVTEGDRTTLDVTETVAGRSVRLELAGSIVVAVEITWPRLPASWKTILGEPDARLDDGTWVFAARGLALTVDGDAVVRALVFAPTTLDGYKATHGAK